MPDPTSFSHESLEADLERLAAEVKKHREAPELKGAAEEEILRHAIKSLPPIAGGKAPPPSEESKSPLPAYAQNAPAEAKLEVEYLLDLAFHHGISRAVSEAKNAPPFVQDTFHDALVGKLYPELKRRGML